MSLARPPSLLRPLLHPQPPLRPSRSIATFPPPHRAQPRPLRRTAILHSSPTAACSPPGSLSMSEPDTKRVRMASSAPVIGTHNGHFHADEALAVYLLRLLPAYRDALLVRTRDPARLEECDVVVDVGGVHDHAALRYDHHQRDFAACFPHRHTKLSSAGLVWLHHGAAIVRAVVGDAAPEPDVDLLRLKLYEDFVEAFDANDNGVAVYDAAALRAAGVEKRFSDKGFSIAAVVNRFNYAKAEGAASTSATAPATGPGAAFIHPSQPASQAAEDARFLRAVAFVGDQFLLELTDRFDSWLPARALVRAAFADRHRFHPGGRIMVIPQQHPDGGAPWADHLYSLEKDHGCEGEVYYVLFAESGDADSKWRVRAVGLSQDAFENRKPLPEAWRGVRDDALSAVAGVPGCVFVHASGFIGGNATFEGALDMARKAVEA